MKKIGKMTYVVTLSLTILAIMVCTDCTGSPPPPQSPVEGTLKQPLHQYTFPIDSGDMRYYTTMQTDAGKISGGPSATITQENGALHLVTKTVGGASSYAGFWHSVNETATNRNLLLDPISVLPWPISTDYQFVLTSWYAIVKGHGDWKVEIKTGPRDNETLVKEWQINYFNKSDYVEVGRNIPSGIEPFKLLNIITETNSDLYFDEIGFYVKTPEMSKLRYAFLTSAAQVFRCYGFDNRSGFNLVRDRSNWPIGDFDSVPGLGFAAMTAACCHNLGMINLDDAKTLVKNCVSTLLAIPSHKSGFLPHWTKIIDGKIQRHPDSEISTVDNSLAFLSAYIASAMLGLEKQRQQILTQIKNLDFTAVTTENNEISHGFDVAGNRIGNTWTSWGGETQLILLLAKLNDPTKNYSYQTSPLAHPNSPVPNGTGFIMEIIGLFTSNFGGKNVGPDRYGVDWHQERLDVLEEQKAALNMPVFIGGQSAIEIVSADGFTRYHVGGTNHLHTGEDGYDSPWVAPHYAAMVAALNIGAATDNVNYLLNNGLMPPLGGPAESILLNASDYSVQRWNSMQGVLNGFFSMLGYYHAVALSETLDDNVYRTNETDSELKAAINSLFVGPPEPMVLQAENGFGDGQIMTRGNAQGASTVWLHTSQTRSINFSTTLTSNVYVTVRYSNDNAGNAEQVDITIDSALVGSFAAADTGDYGYGWNVFVESPASGPVRLEAGDHVISFTVRESTGNGYGIEIDCVSLKFANK